MGGFGSIWHWVLVIVVVLLLFGRGKVSDLMGDVAKGIKSFKKGLQDDDEAPRAAGEPPRPLENQKAAEPQAGVHSEAGQKL